MQRQLTKRISELLMDMDDAPQAMSSVAVNGQSVPESYNSGQHYVELAYLTPAEQSLLAQVDMYNSNPPHPGPAGIPNFNGGGGGGGGGGDGDGDSGYGGEGSDAAYGGQGTGGTSGTSGTGVGAGGPGGVEGSPTDTGSAAASFGGQDSDADVGFEGDPEEEGGTGTYGGQDSDADVGPSASDADIGVSIAEAQAEVDAQAQADIADDDAISVAAQAQAQAQAQADIAADDAISVAAQAQAQADALSGLEGLVSLTETSQEQQDQAAAQAQADIAADEQAEATAIAQSAFDALEAQDPVSVQGVSTATGDSVTDDTAMTEDTSEDVDPADVAAGVIDLGSIPGLPSNTVTEEGLSFAFNAIDQGLNATEALAAVTRAGRSVSKSKGNVVAAQQNAQNIQALTALDVISLEQALEHAALDIPGGGLGRFSPGGFAANNSSTISNFSQITDINAVDPATGQYAVNIPAPQPGTLAFDLAISASRANADAFPGVADAMFSIGSFIPGVGSLATVAGFLENRGLLSDVFSSVTDTITDTIGDTFSDFDFDFDFGVGNVGNVGDVGDVGDVGGGQDDGGDDFIETTDPTTTVPTTTDTTTTDPTTTDPTTTVTDPFALLPGVSHNLPPQQRAALGPYAPPSAYNLPPVFTEADARALLQQTGQLPFAGIV